MSIKWIRPHWLSTLAFEEGKAPEKLIAEKRDINGKVIRTRPLFPYPQVAKYKGSGSTDEEKNFRNKDSASK